MGGYDPTVIEKKWQKFWRDHNLFAAHDPRANAAAAAQPKFYALGMFPYPSGEGLHVGHPEGYTATDIVARYKRARGFNVMHPMGWDAFGLPAEQYALKNNRHPRDTTARNVARFREQLQALGFSYDWNREVNTTDPAYYKWTQWIFLQLFDTWFDEKRQKGRPIAELIGEFQSGERTIPQIQNIPAGCPWNEYSPADQRKILAQYRLAYQAQVPVNWCAALGTVLANEEVIDGKSEVGGFPVERRPMRQWMLRITAYSERLIDGLEKLNWSDSLKEMQRNWIGKSEGAEVQFKVACQSHAANKKETEGNSVVTGECIEDAITVFTTRPDTLYGATFLVLSPEHPLVEKLITADHAAKISAYRVAAAAKSERDRMMESKTKTGVFTGSYAVNPVNGIRVPIYIADYVLMGYGTGAIMAVPAHDERDFDFARQFNLPIIPVVKPSDREAAADECFADEGVAINSPLINGLGTPEAKRKISAYLEEHGLGKKTVNYKIRDWLFARQRYWGEPFPLAHLEDGTTVPLAAEELPVRLPELEDFKPTGTIDPPLSKAKNWVDVHVVINADGTARVVPANTAGAMAAKRELNTMPQWAGSCWYYLRYLDPQNDSTFVDPGVERYWMGQTGGLCSGGVDLYVGGVEHAVLHLLYSRFWQKVLFDRGLVSSDEPFRKLVNQGLILGEPEYTVFRTDSGSLVSYEFVSPELETRPGPDGKLEIISKHKNTGELLIGEKKLPEQVEKKGDVFVLKNNASIRVDSRAYKMSKSRGNVINPDHVIRDYGADSLRLFEMFMGPLEQVKPWSMAGVEGVYRFMQRMWRNFIDTEIEDPVKAVRVVHKNSDGQWVSASGQPANAAGMEADMESILRPMHRLIRKVTDDIERLAFNTAISSMMEFNNALAKLTYIPMEAATTLLRLLEPFAPHVAEELYWRLVPKAGRGEIISISQLAWPVYDAALCVDATIEIPVQINGKVRARIHVANNADESTVLASALADAVVQSQLAGKEPKKKIYVAGRMVNLVV